MKHTTEQDYRSRVLKVLQHIGNHLDTPLSLETLAVIANFSPYHFHRIFRGLVGETLGDYIRRQRLEHAARSLRRGEPVLTTALDSGYESPESFSRAFKTFYGVSPTEYIGLTPAPEPKVTRSNMPLGPDGLLLILPPSIRSLNMNVDITTLKDIPIAFIRHTGAYTEIGPVFERIVGWAVTNGHMRDDTMTLGRYYDDPQSVTVDQLRSDACITVPEDSKTEKDIERGIVPGGLYAKAQFKGPYTGLQNAYNFLYGTWMPSSGREAANAPSMEIYINSPWDTPPEKLLTEIYIPLKS